MEVAIEATFLQLDGCNFGSVPWTDQACKDDPRSGDVVIFSDKMASGVRFCSPGLKARCRVPSGEVEMCDLFATRNYLKLLEMAK